ncbi:MAG: autotransporter outer membrane beta-barrel domain-containing protein, partial [Pseudomonadota bacterium]|nr:autotransporter outer membrane beta-barrel domain-containing protein [Pseudomonadota bacterium]
VSGATNFGVHASSTLAVGTYGAVMSGLSANNITSGTSGTHVSGADRINWTLENIDSTWNLIIADKIDITPDTDESIKTSVKSNTIDSFNDLNSVIEVNFANMNTYDCDSFGKRNGCISLGGRNTHINNPRTRTNGIVLTAGYKFSDSLRVAGFYHRNYEHNTPRRFKLSDKTPLLGTIIVWNQYSNGLGLQIKLATAFQQKHATLIREIVGSSEEGRAKTEIGTKSRVIEFQQGYRFNDDIILHPYLAFRKATSKQDAYSEVGISVPLSFNAIKDEMITALLGLKFDLNKFGNLPDELTFKGSLGIEHDLSHSVSKIEPTGISGLTAVSLTESFNSKRPVASLGFDYEIRPNQRFSGITQFQELPYENKDETNYYLYFTQGF